jgi:hypothetical protein
MNDHATTDKHDASWPLLYKTGGVAALLAALLFRRNISAEYTILRMFGVFQYGPKAPPGDAAGWFSLLQSNPILGLTLLDLFDLINFALLSLVYLALYGALRRTKKSAMLVATAFGLAGMAVYFASNQAFAMLTLSNRHASAATASQQAVFLAAGEALLATHGIDGIHRGSGMYLSYLLVSLAGLIISLVMLKSKAFGKAVGWIGIVAHGAYLIYFLLIIFTPPPEIVAIPPSVSGLFMLVWNLLVGVKLLRLGSGR